MFKIGQLVKATYADVTMMVTDVYNDVFAGIVLTNPVEPETIGSGFTDECRLFEVVKSLDVEIAETFAVGDYITHAFNNRHDEVFMITAIFETTIKAICIKSDWPNTVGEIWQRPPTMFTKIYNKKFIIGS